MPVTAYFLGTAVQTGIGTAVIVRTGKDTAFGAIAQRLAARPPETEFGRGIRHFGLMITRVIMLLVLFVLLVNIVLHRPVLESFLFSIALAVGMTPEMMPMIITITLAQGARRMAGKKVLVKQLSAIEDFGSVEILCSDKTGTLTEGEIVLDRHVDLHGQDNDNVLRLVYLNSRFQAGIKSPLDDAILKHEHPAIAEYEKVDEIPFDFNRKRLSVVVRRGDERLLITKGEAESVFAICGTVIVERGSASVRREPASPGGGDLEEVERRRIPHPWSRRPECGAAGCLCAGSRAGDDTGRVCGIPGPSQGGDCRGSRRAEEERRFRGHYDRRQSVRHAEGSARCRPAYRPHCHRRPDRHDRRRRPGLPGGARRHLRPCVPGAKEPGHPRSEGARACGRVHRRRDQRRSVAPHRGTSAFR